jgi:hypothetical protein
MGYRREGSSLTIYTYRSPGGLTAQALEVMTYVCLRIKTCASVKEVANSSRMHVLLLIRLFTPFFLLEFKAQCYN